MGPIIAVLIPCYNEVKTIAKVVRDFQAAMPAATIYVYDNNSTDGTAQAALDAGAIVRYERRQGKGNVIRAMFREIDADCYIITDGDDTYPAEAIHEMVHLVLEENMDMVIGDRLNSTYFTENRRLFHNSGNLLVRKMVNHLFNGNVTDIMTGYRVFSRIFVKTFPVLSQGFEIETEMTIHALDKNLLVASVPVDYRDRPAGSASKLRTFSDGFKVLNKIMRLYKDYQPLSFFSLVSLVSVFVAAILFIPILVEYLQTGLVPRIPTLITAAFLCLIGVQSFTCGLILDTQVKINRQNFELLMNRFPGKNKEE